MEVLGAALLTALGVPYAVWSREVVASTRALEGLRGSVRTSRLDHPLGDAVRLDLRVRPGCATRRS